MPHAVPGLHLLLGAMVSSGACLRWFRDQFAPGEEFDALTGQAAQTPPGSHGVVFLPYMMGERSPLWHTNARGVFFGVSLASSKAAMIRSILEGAAFALRHNMEVAIGAGAEVREVRSVGGCSRSRLWNQIKADVLNRPLLLPRASVGAPFGDAILAGMGVGLYEDLPASLARMVRLETCFEPNAANHERYTEIYGVFRNIYRHLKGDFDVLAGIQRP
jgi:xylulokinase